MPKKTERTSFVPGYNVWSRRRTIDEAKNIARWSPWIAHEWMAETSEGALVAPSIGEYIRLRHRSCGLYNRNT